MIDHKKTRRVCNECPKTIRVDRGSAFEPRDLALRACADGVALDFSQRGKPTDNAFGEAFNGRLRADCLDTHGFLSLADAAEKLEAWRWCRNEDRPRGAICCKVPVALMKPGGGPGQPPS